MMKLKSPSKPKIAKPKPKTKAKNKNSPMTAISSSDDKRWQMESDARTLKEAMAIRNDPNRMKDAQDHAMKEMEHLKMIAKMKPTVN